MAETTVTQTRPDTAAKPLSMGIALDARVSGQDLELLSLPKDAPFYRLLPIFLFALLPAVLPESGGLPSVLAVAVSCGLAIAALTVDISAKRFRYEGFLELAPMAVYVLFSVLSYIFLRTGKTALLGNFESYESLAARLSFAFMMFYTANTLRTPRDVKRLCAALAAVPAVPALIDAARIIGIFEVSGLPGPGTRLLVICMMLPFAAMLFTGEDQSTSLWRFVKAPLFFIVFAALFAQLCLTDLASAALAIAVSAVLTAVFFFKKLPSWSRALLIMMAACALILTAASKTWPKSLDGLGIRLKEKQELISGLEKSPMVKSASLEENSVRIVFGQEDSVLVIRTSSAEGNILRASFEDGKGAPLYIQPAESENTFRISHSLYKNVFKLCIIKDGETNSLKAQTPGTALSFKSEGGNLKYAADGPGSMWVHCVCIAFLLAVYLVHCAAGLFFKDPGKLPAGFEAAACMCSVFAGAAGMLMCGPAPGALPMFYTLLGAGMAALGASERFSLHRKEK